MTGSIKMKVFPCYVNFNFDARGNANISILCSHLAVVSMIDGSTVWYRITHLLSNRWRHMICDTALRSPHPKQHTLISFKFAHSK